jgi:type I restriction enzyme S subunit
MKGWTQKKLGDVCDFVGGSQPPKSVFSKTLKPGYIRLIQIRDYKSDDHLTFIPKAQARRFCSADDIMIGRYGPPIFQILRGLEGAYNVALMKAVPDETQLDKNFFFYFLKQPDLLNYVIYHSERAAGQIGVTKETLAPYPIPVPPLAEQQRIVGVLDEAMAGIATARAHAETNLQNARALFESHLHAVFTQRGPGWVERTLEEIGRTQTGSTPKTSDQSNYGDFIPFVKPGDFNTDGTLDYDNEGLSKSGAKGARIVPEGSVLMVCIGATIGKCGYCDQDVTTNQQVNALTPSDGSLNRFIYYQMLTEAFQRKVIHASGQATLPIINKSKWSALSLWLPPTLGEQHSIVTQLDALSAETQRLAALYERKLAALEELKKSLLHQAFRGEL